jgi:hypothetical protein
VQKVKHFFKISFKRVSLQSQIRICGFDPTLSTPG